MSKDRRVDFSRQAASQIGDAGLPSRRDFIRMGGLGLLLNAGWHFDLAQLSAASASSSATKALGSPLGYSVQDVAHEAHLDLLQVCGGDTSKKYILETTGSGVAFIDYDNDGWLDIFLVNGSSFELPAI